MHYGEVVDIREEEKNSHKVVDFGKLFLCWFSSNTLEIWYEALLTPQD